MPPKIKKPSKIQYRKLIIDAITTLNKRYGCSLVDIQTYILKKNKKDDEQRLKVQTRIQVRKMDKEDLLKCRKGLYQLTEH
ncbi:MAG: hypothetical protein EZS28_041238 [Streblomastix strix]|uniref:H15 domain-containing protein n=1 Tax=Streblomastix strix TaxID=222440 RepID=A0A5J4TXL3_9EUKA|nr:MAG: hypothetical protein EZS28_041238 [Streblomastix strix]